LDKFDPDLLDDEQEFEEDEEAIRAAEAELEARDKREGREKVLSLPKKPQSDSEEEEEEKVGDGKRQTSLFSFFKRKPKSPERVCNKNQEPESVSLDVSVLKAVAEAEAERPKLVRRLKAGKEPGCLVWAKMQGYPWWPAIVCEHPKQGEVERGSGSSIEVHVKFLGEDHRSWIAASLIKLWDEDVDRSGGNKEEAWLKGMEEAEEAATLTNEERLALLVVDRVEEDDVDDEEDVEGKPLESKRKREKTRLPVNKRRRIVRPADSDSDSDSEEEERYEVEAILKSKEEEGKRLYLIKWKGYDQEEDNTWEPEENIDCKEKLAQFQNGNSEESASKELCEDKLLNRNSKELEMTNRDGRDKSAAAC